MNGSKREQRLESLFRDHGPLLLGYLARRVDPPADAADLFSEILIVAWRRIDEVPLDRQEALAWLLGVARRALSNQIRGVRRRSALVEELRTHVSAAVEDSTPAALDLRDGLARLSPIDREVILLSAWEGLSTGQVAAVLGIEPPAARKRLQRARERLRRELNENAAKLAP